MDAIARMYAIARMGELYFRHRIGSAIDIDLSFRTGTEVHCLASSRTRTLVGKLPPPTFRF